MATDTGRWRRRLWSRRSGGEVDLDGVAGAFAALADPDQHGKILVIP